MPKRRARWLLVPASIAVPAAGQEFRAATMDDLRKAVRLRDGAYD